VSETASTNAIGYFYNWWFNQLGALLTRGRSSSSASRTLLQQAPEGLRISTRSRSSVRHVGTLEPEATPDRIAAITKLVSPLATAKSGDVLLRLAPGEVVERTIQIPEAASDVIEPVLQNQMERIVPWAADDTRYGYRILGPNAANPEQLDIKVVATTRSVLDAALRRARSVGLNPSAVDFAAGPEDETAIELMSLKPDPVKKSAERVHAFLGLVLACSVAVGGFGLYHMWGRQQENDDLQAKIATARARVEEVKRLNQENTELRQQRERLVRRKMEEPAVMVLIEALSRELPDTAFLSELEIHSRDTRIAGKSEDPAALITTLEATPQFADVHFSAATTREEGETAGTFSIIGRAEGGPQLEARP
jgi:general secretion pathway protein L